MAALAFVVSALCDRLSPSMSKTQAPSSGENGWRVMGGKFAPLAYSRPKCLPLTLADDDPGIVERLTLLLNRRVDLDGREDGPDRHCGDFD